MRNCKHCGTPLNYGTVYLNNLRKFCSRKCYGFSRLKNQYDKESIEKHFWAKVNIAGDNECWTINIVPGRNGYAGVSRVFGERKMYAHRLAYILKNGDIEKGLVVMHSCDNRLCCNPNHLSLGTSEDNIHDAARKFRIRQGETHRSAKLTRNDVIKIRNSVSSNRELAEAYGVNKSQISRIRSGKLWKSVPFS